MLRRPGEYLTKRLGEGCSSTAISAQVRTSRVVWCNPTKRGSTLLVRTCAEAVP
jgi:hypothetical protein